MRTRREQVQAYRFVTRRIISALLSGEPETNDLPMRRLGLAIFGSVMVAAIVFAGAGVYGLLTKRGGSVAEETLVIERETGAKYVYLNGKLHPVLNYTSARLILNTAQPAVRTMSQASLRGLTRGQPVGIPNAPDALPESKALLRQPWRVCNSVTPARPSDPMTHVVLGRSLPGGTQLAEESLLVSVNDVLYLLWDGRRLQISGKTALAALKLSAVQPMTVDRQFLDAVPAGPDLKAIPIPGTGDAGSAIGGSPARIGDVFLASGQYYVLTREGLVPIGEVSARLRLAAGGKEREITPQAAGSALAQTIIEPEGFPQALPVPIARATAVCTVHTPGTVAATLEVFTATPEELTTSADSLQVRQTGRDRVPVADRVFVSGGQGALVQAGTATEPVVPGSTLYLVTDQGLKYPLGAGAQVALGYGEVEPIGMPASVLALVPTGPTLDSASAQRFVEANPAPGPSPESGSPRSGDSNGDGA
ncbi:MAG TPA: type VII secretion protein EccB [Micromonosporaceae bacterium]|nr:type VII secretion protein EccB [Micromonosporaceae bacterium]